MNNLNQPILSRLGSLCLLICVIAIAPVSLTQAETVVPTPPGASTKQDDLMDDFTGEGAEEPVARVSDPLESFNRAMFTFNDKAYVYVLKPIAIGYRKVVPEKGRVSIKNFFTNLTAPVRIVNAGFQLKGEDASNEFARFLINTTFGLVGLFDVAKDDFGIDIKKEDFGQTLGHYGVGNGAYLVLPLLGPSTIRDGIGQLVDGSTLDLLNYIYDDELEKYVVARWIDVETDLSLDKDTYEALKRDALDPYVFIRNAYIQLRAGAVKK